MATHSLQKCIHCRERAVQRAILPTYTQEMEHEGKTYKVTLANFEVYRCGNCGEASLDGVATERLMDGLRAEVGLLTPSEIRRKREAFGLNQQQLADLLRISMYTLSRWESGGQIQKKSMDLMLRAFFDVPEFRHYVGAVVQEATQPPATAINERTEQLVQNYPVGCPDYTNLSSECGPAANNSGFRMAA